MVKKPQAPHTLDELVALVRERFPGLSPQFQIGARYLIDNPDQVPVLSMRRIAANAGVQPATLVRLAQALGYDGWDTMRQVFVRSLHQIPRRYAEQARVAVQRRNARSILSRHVATQLGNMRLLEELNDENLSEAARLLARARHVHVAGFRASYAAAYTLHYQYRLFRNTVTLVRGDVGLLEMELRAIDSGDAVVVIGFAPYSQEAMRVAESAKASGCHVIAICDSKVAPVAHRADVVLLFPTDTPSFFPSTAAAMVLVEALVNRLLGRAGRQAIDALGLAEEQLRQTGAYLEPNVEPDAAASPTEDRE